MSAHVLLYLLNELRIRDKMQGFAPKLCIYIKVLNTPEGWNLCADLLKH